MAYIYAGVVALATILGGLLPFTRVFKKMNNIFLVAFAAGAMLGIAFFDLIPEAAELEANLYWIGVGFLFVYILERFFALHAHADEHEHLPHVSKSAGLVSLIGVVLESLIDGIAIAVGVAIEPVLGIAIAAAVLVHEIPRGFTTAVIINSLGYKKIVVALALAVDALFTIFGVALGNIFPQQYFPHLIAFAAGVFLFVGGGDLLPPAHRKTRWSVILTAIAGAVLIYIVTLVVHTYLE